MSADPLLVRLAANGTRPRRHPLGLSPAEATLYDSLDLIGRKLARFDEAKFVAACDEAKAACLAAIKGCRQIMDALDAGARAAEAMKTAVIGGES